MSHYTVGVFLTEDELKGKDIETVIEGKLIKYCEDTDCVPHEYLEFEDRTDEVNDHIQEKAEEGKTVTFEEAAEEYFGYTVEERDGRKVAGYYYNHNAKWDWYQIGGRWSGLIRLKDGERSSFSVLKDIYFNPTQKSLDEANRFWELYVEKGMENLTEEEKKELGFVFYKREFYIERYKTKEEYVKQTTDFSTYAVLDENGWHEPGPMGWFGVSGASAESEENFKKGFYDNFIKGRDMNKTYLAIVDCHI